MNYKIKYQKGGFSYDSSSSSDWELDTLSSEKEYKTQQLKIPIIYFDFFVNIFNGRKVKNFTEDIWNSACEEIMFNGNILKYYQNEDLKNLHLATENKEIVEASPYEKIQDKNSWNGQNKLGICLMKVRDQLKN